MPTTMRTGLLTCVLLSGALALSGCKMLKEYYTADDSGPEEGDGAHGGHGGHGGGHGGHGGGHGDEHGKGGHDSDPHGDAGEHAPAPSASTSASASAAESAPLPPPPASAIIDGELRCTNPRHLAFAGSGKSGNFCALPCRGAGFDQDCPDGAKCSASAAMVEKGKIGAYKSYCVSKVVPPGADAATTVVAVDPHAVAIVDAGGVVELTDGGIALPNSDGGPMNINKVLKGMKFKKKPAEPAPAH